MNEMAECKKMPNQAYDRRAGLQLQQWVERGGLASSVMECGNSLALISIGKRLDGGTHCAQLK